MLLTAAALITLFLAAVASRMLAPRAVNNLGWMSEGWLAEYRASHP